MLDDIQLTRLPNGLAVASSRIADAESVSVGIWIGVGGRHEPARLSGVSHFIEHMLFKGTARRSAAAISQAIEGRGGYLNAYTQEDATCFYARLPHERLPEALDVLTDMLLAPRFSPTDVERERAVILEELRMYRDQPQTLVQEELQEALWPEHPLGRPLTGSEATLAACTPERLVGYWQRHYTPRNTVVAFAGRLEHADVLQAAAAVLGRRPAGRAWTCPAADAGPPAERLRLLRRDIEQVHVALGMRTFGRHDRRRHALRMLNAVLGEAMSSRLFQALRERHGLAYSIQSSYQLFADSGCLTIAAGLDRDRAAAGLSMIGREMARLAAEPVPGTEWRRLREYLLGQFRLGLEGAASHMSWIGETTLQHGRIVPPAQVLDQIAAVTPAQVQALAAALFRPTRLSLALVVPGDDTRTEAEWQAALVEKLKR